MLDVKASNEKLIARAVRIVVQATDCSKEEAREKLEQTHYDVKLAILMLLTGSDLNTAQKQLSNQQGFLRRAVEISQAEESESEKQNKTSPQ